MTIRPVNLEVDYPMLQEWWQGHGALPVPLAFLPQGFIAEEDGPIAACFLYLDVSGKCSMIEYLTTNPACSFSKKSLQAFKALVAHCEQLTLAQGCRALISMVAPGSSEERIFGRLGYLTSRQTPHLMFGKILQPCP